MVIIDPRKENAVEIFREAVRIGSPIGSIQGVSMTEVVREVGAMMKGLMDSPFEMSKVQTPSDKLTKNKAKEQDFKIIASQGERALVASLASQTAFAIIHNENVLAVETLRQIANVPVKLAQIGAISNVLGVIDGGAFVARKDQVVEEHYSPKSALFSKNSLPNRLISRIMRRRDEYQMAPGTKIGLKIYPDTPTIIEPSRSAAAFALAEGKGSRSSAESGKGIARAQAQGDRAVAMAASAEIGGAQVGGGGGMSFSVSGGSIPDFDF